MRRFKITEVVAAIVIALSVGGLSLGQESGDAATLAPKNEQDEKSREELFKGFGELLKKSVMVGTFMIDGDDNNKRINERYEISKVVKQPQGDYWMFFSRIKYGSHDVTLPIPVEVKWAGTTPVITVDNLTIPGMGTFDSRVVIADGKYAGTWRHGKVGGLMFGHLEKQKAADAESDKPAEASK